VLDEEKMMPGHCVVKVNSAALCTFSDLTLLDVWQQRNQKPVP